MEEKGGVGGGGRLKAINVCCAGLRYSRDGAFVHFGKARRESFTLKLGARHNRRHCRAIVVSCAVRLVSARLCISFFFVITTLLTLFVRASRFLSFCFSPALAFVALFPSAAPPHPPPPRHRHHPRLSV